MVRTALTALVVAAAFALAAAAQAQTPITGDVDAGRDAFGEQCRTCHNGAIAPSLRGVVGRPIAGQADFPVYSDALKAKHGQVWTEASLDAFLTAPADFAPGTKMAKTVADAQMRADLVAYLKSLTPPK